MSELYNNFIDLHNNILENIVDKLSTKFCFNKKDAINFIKNSISCDTLLYEERIDVIDLNNHDENKENIPPIKKKIVKKEKKNKKEVDSNAPKKKRGRPKKEHTVIIDSSDDEDENNNNCNTDMIDNLNKNLNVNDNLTKKLINCVENKDLESDIENFRVV